LSSGIQDRPASKKKKKERCQAVVAHFCNPSYSGGRDQENGGSKPVWTNNSLRPYLKKRFSKIGLVEWLKVKALSSSPSTAKKKKKEKSKKENQ
jgi:hypothetical protein